MQPFKVYPRFEIEPTSGQGAYIFDAQGNKYLDLYGGHAVISVGHSHPHFVKAIQQQSEKLVFYSNSVENKLQIKLAEKLGEVAGLNDYQLFLCNSGAEANENALKMASFHTGKTKIIAFENAFHGRTSAAVNITDNEKIQAPINKGFEVIRLKFDDLKAVKKEIEKGDVCGVIIEGIQGVGGIHIPKSDFLKEVEAICKKENVIFILDEIQSGYGRSGKFFAFQYADIQPDLITVAKGMGNGFPIGGLLLSSKFKAKFGLLGTTFGGNHLASAAGLAVLEIIEKENLIEHSNKIGIYLMNELNKMKSITEVRGRGLMIGIEFPFPIKKLRAKLLHEEKIFTGSSSNPNVLRILPPLNLTQDQATHFLKTLNKIQQ